VLNINSKKKVKVYKIKKKVLIVLVFNLRLVSQNTNDRGWFVKVKTRLTTKRKEKCERRGDYIYVAKG
jgi:hypothetical protein